jgi:predicted RNA-binding protein with RPS1 domain
VTSFGAFVELKDGIDGLVHISQISEERIEKVKDVLKPDQKVTARVIKIDRDERRLGLSIKAANYSADQLAAETATYEALNRSATNDMMNLGDILDEASKKGEQPIPRTSFTGSSAGTSSPNCTTGRMSGNSRDSWSSSFSNARGIRQRPSPTFRDFARTDAKDICSPSAQPSFAHAPAAACRSIISCLAKQLITFRKRACIALPSD